MIINNYDNYTLKGRDEWLNTSLKQLIRLKYNEYVIKQEYNDVI